MSAERGDHLKERSVLYSRVVCAIAAVFPVVAAVGWFFHVPSLVRGLPTLPAMQLSTVAGLLTSVTAVLLSNQPIGKAWAKAVSLALAALVMLFGSVVLLEYALGLDIGIDRIFTRFSSAFDHTFPGRSAPQTAANFALLGAGVIFYSSRLRSIRMGQACAIAVAANCIIVITGYIFNTTEFYGFPIREPETGMAVHTAISFILLVFALISGSPSEGMMGLITSDSRTGVMARSILFTAIFAPPAVGALTRIGVRMGFYDISVQVSLFAVLLVGVILRKTWQAARRSEIVEREVQRISDEQRIFAALIENSSDFIGIADASGKPIYVNPAGRQMVGLAPDLPVGETQIPEYYPPEHRKFATEVIYKTMVEKGYWKGEIYFRNWRTEGSIPVSDTHFMVRDPKNGRVLGMATITRDISDLRQAEEALQKMRDEWTSLIAHDLRQPISVVKMCADILPMLHNGEMNEKERTTNERIRSSAISLSRMVDDLLDLSHMEAHRMVLEKKWADPRSLVRETVERLTGVTAGFQVQVQESGELTPIFVDPIRIEQVLGNLLSNAAKYGQKGTEILIRLVRRETGIEVTVSNRGPGIPASDMPLLFNRFSRTRATHGTGVPGLGLGLYISKGLVEAHGGRIWVESVPGETTTFYFTLPLAPAEVSAARA